MPQAVAVGPLSTPNPPFATHPRPRNMTIPSGGGQICWRQNQLITPRISTRGRVRSFARYRCMLARNLASSSFNQKLVPGASSASKGLPCKNSQFLERVLAQIRLGHVIVFGMIRISVPDVSIGFDSLKSGDIRFFDRQARALIAKRGSIGSNIADELRHHVERLEIPSGRLRCAQKTQRHPLLESVEEEHS